MTSTPDGYHRVMGDVFSTFPGFPAAHIFDRREVSRRKIAATILARAKRGDTVIINGAVGLPGLYFDQFLGLALRLFKRGVHIVVADATWHARALPGESRAPWLARPAEAWGKLLLRLLAGPRTHVCFLSRSECSDFILATPARPDRVHFTKFCTTIWASQLAQLRGVTGVGGEAFAFAGGNASRNYPILLDAAAGVPLRFRVATSQKLSSAPANVDVTAVTLDEFLHLMAASQFVVLPLSTGTRRSAGQQTYLNAMLLGKLVIVTAATGVEDYLKDGLNAIVVRPHATSLRAAIDWVLDPANADQVTRIAGCGQALAERLSSARYTEELVHIARAAAHAG